MSELPIGWINTQLGDVIELKYGKALPDRERSGDGYPVYGSNGIVGYHSAALTAGETIVVGRKGSVGEVSYSPIACSPIDTTYYVDQFPTENPKYWFYKLKQLDLRRLNKSTAIPGFNRGDAYSLVIQLPPFPEQKRIADKLDAVLARVDACRERLDIISIILSRLRQSILNAAIAGELTEDWSTENNCDVTEDLKIVHAAREGRARKIESTNNHDVVTQTFAKRWQIETFDKLFDFLDYRGKTPNKSSEGKRLITAKNIKMGFVQDHPVEYLSESDYLAWMTRGFPRQGDIFFVTEGHTMGCVAVNNRTDQFALAQRTITLQPIAGINTKFYFYYMLSDSFQKLIDLNATGTAARGIKASKLRGLPVPFPSFDEQHEIVRRIETQFSFADRIEVHLKTARTAADRLIPALLAKAFRGELVPQDPNDEPAAALLARLHANATNTSAVSKARKPRKSNLGIGSVATIVERAA